MGPILATKRLTGATLNLHSRPSLAKTRYLRQARKRANLHGSSSFEAMKKDEDPLLEIIRTRLRISNLPGKVLLSEARAQLELGDNDAALLYLRKAVETEKVNGTVYCSIFDLKNRSLTNIIPLIRRLSESGKTDAALDLLSKLRGNIEHLISNTGDDVRGPRLNFKLIDKIMTEMYELTQSILNNTSKRKG